MVRLTMDRERMKYLFREMLGVDVDDVVRKVVATIAVERAKQVQQNTSTSWGGEIRSRKPAAGRSAALFLPARPYARIVLNRTYELGT